MGRIFKIYNYTNNSQPKDFSTPPFDLNYDILGLYKKRIFNKGELNTVEYYGEYNFSANTFSDLVVFENRIYYRVNEMVHRREMDIFWLLDDNTTGATKHTIKYYTPEESIVVGERRRSKIIATMKTEVVGLIMAVSGVTQQEAEVIGKPFLATYANEITQYISGYEAPMKDVLLNSTTFSWLDSPIDIHGTKVRDYIYDSINIDYTINNVYM